MAGPVPVDCERVIHGLADDAIQEQADADGVMVMEPDPPAAGCTGLLVLSVMLQGRPAWVIENGAPPMVTTEDRLVGVLLGATVNTMSVVPLPELLDAVTQVLGRLVDQEHPAAVNRRTVVDPPEYDAAKLLSDSVKAHPLPVWSTVKVRPPAVIVPVRLGGAAFDAAVKVSNALPVPEAGLTDSQAAELLAVHGQDSLDAVSVSDPEPPLNVSEAEGGERVNEHPAPNCTRL